MVYHEQVKKEPEGLDFLFDTPEISKAKDFTEAVRDSATSVKSLALLISGVSKRKSRPSGSFLTCS